MRWFVSLANRLRWPLLVLGLLAVLSGAACWLFLPSDPIGPRAFERIRLGMTKEEIETVIGFPAGNYQHSSMVFRWIYATKVSEEGPAEFELIGLQSEEWYGDSYRIKVVLDADKKVVAAFLYKADPDYTVKVSLLNQLRAWLGL